MKCFVLISGGGRVPARDGALHDGQEQLRSGDHARARGWHPQNYEGTCSRPSRAGRGVSIEFHYVRISHLCM